MCAGDWTRVTAVEPDGFDDAAFERVRRGVGVAVAARQVVKNFYRQRFGVGFLAPAPQLFGFVRWGNSKMDEGTC